jgi:hypothetical protein
MDLSTVKPEAALQYSFLREELKFLASIERSSVPYLAALPLEGPPSAYRKYNYNNIKLPHLKRALPKRKKRIRSIQFSFSMVCKNFTGTR